MSVHNEADVVLGNARAHVIWDSRSATGRAHVYSGSRRVSTCFFSAAHAAVGVAVASEPFFERLARLAFHDAINRGRLSKQDVEVAAARNPPAKRSRASKPRAFRAGLAEGERKRATPAARAYAEGLAQGLKSKRNPPHAKLPEPVIWSGKGAERGWYLYQGVCEKVRVVQLGGTKARPKWVEVPVVKAPAAVRKAYKTATRKAATNPPAKRSRASKPRAFRAGLAEGERKRATPAARAYAEGLAQGLRQAKKKKAAR